jgi:hypothetical protein
VRVASHPFSFSCGAPSERDPCGGKAPLANLL